MSSLSSHTHEQVEDWRASMRCKCGIEIPTPEGGLDHAKIARILGASTYCEKCEPPRGRAMRQMAQEQSKE